LISIFTKIYKTKVCIKVYSLDKMKSLIVMGCLIVFICSSNYTLVLLSQERGAACLDGSPVGLYINEGKGENKDNFLIYFNSGGFCGAGNLSDTL